MPAQAPTSRRAILIAGGGLLVIRGAAIGLTVLASVVLARAMGVEGYGSYALALSLLSLIGIPVQMGIPTLVLRETSGSAAVGDWGRMRAVWAWATRRIVLMAPLALVAGLGGIALVAPGNAVAVALIGAPLVPLIALGLARDAALRGLHRIMLGQVSETILRPAATLVLIALAWGIGGQRVGPGLAMALSVLAAAIAFGFGIWLLARHRPRQLREAAPAPVDPAWARAIWPLAGLVAVQGLGQHLGVVILGSFAAATDVAHFKIAQSANGLAVVGLGLVSLVIAPRIAHMQARGERAALQRLVAIGAALSLAALLPAVAVLVVWGQPLLSFLYGADYLASWPLLMVLLVGQCVNAFFGTTISLLNMTGNERFTLQGIAVGTATNLVVALALVPGGGAAGGAMGAAIGASTAMVVWNLMLWRSALRRTGIDTTIFGVLRKPVTP